jgi:hypothetical protein
MVKAVVREYRGAVKQRTKAAATRRKGAKLPATQKKQDKAYRDAAKKVAKLERSVLSAQSQLPVPRARSLPKVMEIGLTYSAAKGRIASDVNVNIRIRRTDGRGVSEDDAKRALFAIGSGEASLPDDLEVSGVEWQRPQKSGRSGSSSWKQGSEGDVWNFHPIVSSLLFPSRSGADYGAFRMGHVKEDVL